VGSFWINVGSFSIIPIEPLDGKIRIKNKARWRRRGRHIVWLNELERFLGWHLPRYNVIFRFGAMRVWVGLFVFQPLGAPVVLAPREVSLRDHQRALFRSSMAALTLCLQIPFLSDHWK
jgi:hypothetical protein